ncbi:Utp14 protein-domain-containing protein [Tricharina praecox]|uniref:Utp14 protein-domain-containing protein n=1 Tax=Tricharina praecox TaxID=43433 RepID=UPI00221F9B28|nr:Utp14 protein-domain-containing protein [Tricharina praecox]KAI5854000.1 Utp14 protein-domain-containing protein [Tricharina praecox]
MARNAPKPKPGAAKAAPAGPASRKSRGGAQKRALNAFAIASAADNYEQQSRAQSKKRAARSADDDDDGDESEGSVDGGEDSDGNEWRLGEVDEDDDSDIDSDDAMGESDEERFEDFAFRGSTGDGKKGKGKVRRKGVVDLSEEEEDGSDEDEDMEGEGYIDLSEMLDRVSEDEDGDEESEEDKDDKKAKKGRKRAAPESDDEVGDFGAGSSEGESDDDSFTKFSDEEDDEEEDELALEALESAITALPSSNDRPAKRLRIQDANEGKTPGEYNLSIGSDSKKLTIHDLMSSVADPTLKKSLKLLAADDKGKSDKKGVPGKLSAPLAKRMQDKIDRAAAYGQTKETLKRWVDTVKHNREAEHLHFPLANAPNAAVPASKKLIAMTAANSKPLNAFEASISGILKESNMDSEKKIQEFEQLATQKLSIEDVQRRTAELRKARELMYREELKAKRIKKIKSKSYHRIKKKERMRQDEAIQSALAEERDGEPDSDEEMERERRRAEERMSLKHKKSKWAKGVKDSGRGAWDDDARTGAMEMAKRSEDLRRKIAGKEIGSDGEESSDDDSDDEFDEEGVEDRLKALKELEKIGEAGKGGKGSNLMAMKFMQRAEAAKRKENDAMIQSLKEDWDDEKDSDSDDENDAAPTGRMVFKPGKPEVQTVSKKQDRNEFEAPPTSDDEDDDEDEIELTNNASSKTIKKQNPFSAPSGPTRHKDRNLPFTTDSVGEQEEVNPWLPVDSSKTFVKPKAKALGVGKQDSKGAKVNHKLSKDRRVALDAAQQAVDGDTRVTIDTNLTLKIARVQNSDDEAEQDEEGQIQLIPTKGKKSESQRELVKMAFAGDNVVQEFKREKQQIAEEDDDKVIDQTLPGWGAWTGTGLSKQQRGQNNRRKKVLQTIKGISKDSRKDSRMEKVIISERRDKKAAKFQTPTLPHPFETKGQYERSLRVPIGPEWTTKSTFQNATMPRVMVKTGRVVEPISAPFK